MLTYLYNKYGIIIALDIIENGKQMDKPYDLSEAIETYLIRWKMLLNLVKSAIARSPARRLSRINIYINDCLKTK